MFYEEIRTKQGLSYISVCKSSILYNRQFSLMATSFGTNAAVVIGDHHYENMPIQIHRKFHLQELKKNQIKNSDIFHISAQNIDCGYSLEPPRRGGSNEYPQSMF